MQLSKKLILHTPISERSPLPGFVADCIEQNVVLIAIVGTDCQAIEDEIDWLIIGESGEPNGFITTTVHPSEEIDDVLYFVSTFAPGSGEPGQQIWL